MDSNGAPVSASAAMPKVTLSALVAAPGPPVTVSVGSTVSSVQLHVEALLLVDAFATVTVCSPSLPTPAGSNPGSAQAAAFPSTVQVYVSVPLPVQEIWAADALGLLMYAAGPVSTGGAGEVPVRVQLACAEPWRPTASVAVMVST